MDALAKQIETDPASKIYIFINITQDIMRFSSTNDINAETEVPFATTPHNFTAQEICKIGTQLGITEIEFPGGMSETLAQFSAHMNQKKLIQPNIDDISSFYLKKAIFLVKRTQNQRYLHCLRVEPLIILAMPKKATNLKKCNPMNL